MTPAILTTLQTTAQLHAVYGDPDTKPRINTALIEKDGRKLKAALRELVDAGYIEEADKPGDYRSITPKARGEIVGVEPDLVAIWKEKHIDKDGRWDDRKNWPFLRVGLYGGLIDLTVEQLEYVLRHHETYNWYVVNSWAMQHSNRLGTNDLRGVHTLPEARDYNNRVRNLPTGERLSESEIVVADTALEGFYANFVFDRRVNESFAKNLPWGLVTLGVVTEEEGELIRSGGFGGGPLLLGSRQLGAGDEPANWGTVLDGQIDRLVTELAGIPVRLAVLRKIDKGVAALGGWDKFRADMRAKLVEALRKQEAAAEVPAEAVA